MRQTAFANLGNDDLPCSSKAERSAIACVYSPYRKLMVLHCLLFFILTAEGDYELIHFVCADQWSVLEFRQNCTSIVCSAV